MAASLLKWDELSRLWQRNEWHPVYLFAGQEDFLIEVALQRLRSQWLSGDDSRLNDDRLDAEEHAPGEILALAQTVPFLAERRLIQVDDAASFSAADTKLLAAAIPSLPASTRMVLVWGREWKAKDASNPLVKAVQDAGAAVIFWPLFTEAARRWVQERARTHGKSIDPEAAAWLVEEAGEGLRRLDQELQKCSLFVGGRPAIELADVQSSFGYGRASSPYEWIDALRRRQPEKALDTLKQLLEEGEEPIRLLALASRSVHAWLSAKHPRETPASLAMRFRIRRGQENAFFHELQKWSEERLAEALDFCAEMDYRIKAGKETPEIGLTLTTLRLGGAEGGHFLR